MPIPDRQYTGLIKYDAKDPESKFPAIEPLRPPKGAQNVLIVLLYEGGGLGKGGSVFLFVDANKVGEGRVGATQPMIFSCDETMNVGCETGSMVTEDYAAKTSRFNGKIHWIQLDQGIDDHDHLITAEERMRVAMARQ